MEAELSMRERKKTQTRRDIVRAAVELFREKGFEATTVDEIVERADYSRPTFFRHFATKEDVVFANATARLDQLKRLLESSPRQNDAVANAQAAVIAVDVETFGAASDADRAVIELWFSEDAFRRRYLEIVAEWEVAIADYLIKASTRRFQANVVAAAIIGVARAATEEHLATGRPIERLHREGFALLDLTSTGSNG